LRKAKVKKPGRVEKVIKSLDPSEPEKAQISVEGADELYREIRIENKLQDEEGNKVKLKPGAEVEVVVEADKSATIAESSRA
jgi:predicted DNA-binding antitoxin AbrB/MazE fold protein